MKTFIIAATAAVAVFTGGVTEAKAGSCDSLASGTARIWKDWAEVVKTAGCVVATVASEGTIPLPKCVQEANKYDQALQDMIKKWNSSAQNGSGKIGPRMLDIGDSQKGTLVGTFGRVFISAAPLKADEIEIELTKTDGRSKTEVTVCTEDPQRNRKKEWTFTVENGKDNIGKTFRKTIKGVSNHIVMIHLDGRSVADKFSYKLKVTPQKGG